MTEPGQRTIVQVVPYYPPHLGGMENVARTIAEGLAERHEVEVLTTTCGAPGVPRVERAGNLTVRRLRTVEFAHMPISPGLFGHLLRAPRTAIVHVHVAQALTPEIVWLAAVLRRRPFIAHFHLDVDPSGRWGRIFLAVYKRRILGRTLRAASRVIVLSDGLARFLVERYRVRPEAIVVAPNGVGPEFRPASVTATREPGPCRLLFVGRIAPQKALPRLLHAIALMHEPVDAAIVGDGEDSASVQNLASELALTNVRFVGTQLGEDLVRWYQWADVFVLPSEKEGGMSLVVMEAMASGLPVVATDVQGTGEALAGTGLLTSPDPESLAAALDRVADDPALRAELAARSLLRAQEYSWPRLVQRLESLYADVLPSPERAGATTDGETTS